MDPDLDTPATKRDLAHLRTELVTAIAEEIARATNAMMEHMTSLFRVADDRTKTVEEKLDAHIADDSVHKRPRRRARG